MKLLGCVVTLSLFTLCYTKDYCSLCQYHTMCGTTNAGEKCSEHTPMPPTASEKQALLDTHNKLRNKVATGSEIEGKTGPMPSAANMMKMEWDDELATISQRLADQCVFGHDCDACTLTRDERFGVGQNIAQKSSSRPFSKVDFVEMTEGWYKTEVGLMDKALVDSFIGGKWGHYSQVVWWNTRLVGCGASFYSEDGWYNQYLVCNYGTAGNMPNAKVYQKGAPASQCPTGTAKDSTFPGLCALQSKPANGKFPETDNKLLGLPPGTFFGDPDCEREGFRV